MIGSAIPTGYAPRCQAEAYYGPGDLVLGEAWAELHPGNARLLLTKRFGKVYTSLSIHLEVILHYLFERRTRPKTHCL